MGQIEVISGVERRRRWSEEEKKEHVAQAFAAGGNARSYCRQKDIAPSALYKWRRQYQGGFVRVMGLENGVEAGGSGCMNERGVRAAAIELETLTHRVRIPATMPPALAVAVIRALVRR